MAGMDVFNDNAFSVTSLTATVNSLPYVPRQVSQLGIIEERGVSTTSVWIERRGNALALVPATPRGSDPTPHVTTGRDALPVGSVRIAKRDTIMADSVQNVREFGSENQLLGVQTVVNDRLAEMTADLDATMEYHSLGALKGVVYDADGTRELHNMFTLFGVAQQATVDLNLDAATPARGVLRKAITGLQRKIEAELGGLPYTRLHAYVGAAFFDDFISHADYQTYLTEARPADLVGNLTVDGRRTVSLGGLTIEEYRGRIGSIDFLDEDEGIMFPIGVPGLFIRRFVPADYMEAVNTIGLPRYAKQGRLDDFDRGRSIEVQTNVVTLCTRPRVLIPLART